MNWIEIDQILYRIIERHTSAEDVYKEAEKQFKWDRKQTRDAVDPLLKRHTDLLTVAKMQQQDLKSVKTTKKSSKKLRNK